MQKLVARLALVAGSDIGGRRGRLFDFRAADSSAPPPTGALPGEPSLLSVVAHDLRTPIAVLA